MYRMSVLNNQTAATPNDYFFEKADGQINILNISSLITTNIVLDAITMDCGYIGPASTPTLLLNGAPVASTSSFTSSIVSWSQYPAIAPITYTGGGGVANFTNVNAAGNVSSLTANTQALTVSSITGNVASLTTLNAAANVSTLAMTVSSINGLSFPSNATTPVVSSSGAAITNGAVYTVSLSGQPAGFYLLSVSIQSGSGLDPMSCTCMFQLSGGNLAGGSLHMPSINSQVPSTANCVSIQDTTAGSAASVVIYSNDNTTGLGITPQFSFYRIS